MASALLPVRRTQPKRSVRVEVVAADEDWEPEDDEDENDEEEEDEGEEEEEEESEEEEEEEAEERNYIAVYQMGRPVAGSPHESM